MSKNKQDEDFDLLYSRCSSLIDLAKRLQKCGEGLEYDLREFRDDLRESKNSGRGWQNPGLEVHLMFLGFRAAKIMRAAKAVEKNVAVVQETYNQEGLGNEQE